MPTRQRAGNEPRLSLVVDCGNDVASIVEYIAADNLDAALRFVDRLTATFELIAAQPNLGERYGDDRRRMRRTSVGNYLVFYQSLPDEVLVVRVLHAARQWENLL